MADDSFVSVREAAKRAGKSEDTIRRWLDEGRLQKFTRPPREVLVNTKELDRYRAPRPSL